MMLLLKNKAYTFGGRKMDINEEKGYAHIIACYYTQIQVSLLEEGRSRRAIGEFTNDVCFQIPYKWNISWGGSCINYGGGYKNARSL